MKINLQHQRFLFFLLLIASFWSGRLSLQYQIHRELPPVQTVAEINEQIPLVTITDISNAKVFGTTNRPNIRIISEGQVAVPDEKLQFQLNIEHLGYIGPKRPVIEHLIPESAQFVASKKGKYFYALNEKQARRLSVENRVYFENEEEAEKEGYLRR